MSYKWIHLLFRGNKADFEEFNSPLDDYTSKFASINHHSLTIPLLEFKYRNSLILYEKLAKQKDPNCRLGLILTSPRVVDAVNNSLNDHDHLGTRQDIIDAWKTNGSRHVYAVGVKTSQLCARLLDIEVATDSSNSGSASELSKFIIHNIKDDTIHDTSNFSLLYPHSNLADEAFHQLLCDNGIKIEPLIAYQTDAISNLKGYLSKILSDWKSANLDFEPEQGPYIVNLIFFSPSGVRSLQPHLAWLESKLKSYLVNSNSNLRIVYSCIGPSTKTALSNYGLKAFCVASQPNSDALTQDIIKQSAMATI